jgi:hypothetical protein
MTFQPQAFWRDHCISMFAWWRAGIIKRLELRRATIR